MRLLYYGNNIEQPALIGDCGYDLRSTETIWLQPKQVYLFSTGVHVRIPEGYFGMITERSSLGAKGIAVRGGIIDSSYTGEILVCLQNLTDDHIRIGEDERIAQMIIIPYATPKLEPVQSVLELGATERSFNGFGSTGK